MRRNRSGLPEYCGWSTDRQGGKRRVRFRKDGITKYIYGVPWSSEFMQQYGALLDQLPKPAIVGAGRTKAGTVNALAAAYYQSPDFRSLADSTKDHRRRIIDQFRSKHGSKPLKGLRREHIVQIMADKAETPEAANNLVKLLRVMLNYAVDLGMIESNPATGIKRYKNRGVGFHSWSEDEIRQYEARHPVGTRARLVLALPLYTAQRVSDVCKMGWQHVINGDMIKLRQQKTGASLTVPLHPALKAMLAILPRTNLTFIVTERDAPFTAQGLSNFFKKQCCLAGLPHCSIHGLRKAAVTRLVNAGCSNEQIKAITGHRSDSALAPYKRAGDQRLLARQAMNMQLGSEGEQDLSSIRSPIVQPRAK